MHDGSGEYVTPLLTHGEINQRATTGAMTIMARGLAVRAVGMLGNIVLARMLVPSDFGMISLGITIVTLGDFLASGGLGAALVRQSGPVERSDLEAIFGFQLLATIAIATVTTAVGVPLSKAGALAAIMIWSLVIDTGRAPTAIPLQREMAYRLVLQAEVIETIVWNAFAVAAVAAGFGVWGVAAAQVVRALAGFLVLTIRGPIGFVRPRLDWSRTRHLLSFGAQFQGVQAVMLVRDQGMTVAIAAIGGFTALGVWSVVYRLTTVVTILMESLWRVSFPAMSRLRETGADPAPVITRALGVASTLSGFLVVPLAGASPALIPVLFGPHWASAIDVMPAAAAAIMLAGPLGAVAIGYLLSEGKAGLILRMATLDGLSMWAVGLPLLALTGVIGIGFGQLAAGATDLAFLTVVLWRTTSVNSLSPTLIPLVAVAGGVVPAWLICSWLGPNVASLVASIAVGEALYVAALLVVRRATLIDAAQIGLRTARRLAHAA